MSSEEAQVGHEVADSNSNHKTDKSTAGDNLPSEYPPFYPFTFEYRPTKWQRTQFYLMLVFVFPVRFVISLVFLMLMCLLGQLAVTFHPVDAQYRFSAWRRALKWPVQKLLRLIFFTCGIYYVKVKGRRASIREAPILCPAPHSSFLDIITGAVDGFPVSVSTKGNLQTPVVGTLFRLTEAIFIDRSCASSREKSGLEIARRALTMGEWPHIMTFPEGCCGNGKSLLTFKRGAFIAAVPVQPILIRYRNSLDNSTWVDTGPNQVAMFFVLMCTPITDIEMEYLPVYYPSEEEKKDPDVYAENVRQHMAKHLKVPTSGYTYKDLKALLNATGKPKVGIIKFLQTLWTEGEVIMPKTA